MPTRVATAAEDAIRGNPANRMPEPPEHIVMIACRDTQDRWRLNEGTGQIRNGENDCWSLEGPARPGTKIVGTPCRPKVANQRFDVQM
jgi:hypothetical protein